MDKDRQLEIFYIRHADTTNAHVEGECDLDIGISELGEKQCILLADRFCGCRFDAVFSSPLIRAVKTAARVCEKLANSPEIEIIPELIENGTMPGYTGINISLLSRYYNKIKICNDTVFRNLGNTFTNLSDTDNDLRGAATSEYFKKRFSSGEKILVFAHGSFGNHFIPASVGMPSGDYILSINNTSVTKIKYTYDGKQRISFCNDFSHLRPLMPDYEFTV